MEKKYKSAKLKKEQIEDIKDLEEKFGDGVCIIAIEKPSPPIFILEAKTSPKNWEKIKNVYPVDNFPSSYTTREEAMMAKSALKGLLSGPWLGKYRKNPIRIREV